MPRKRTRKGDKIRRFMVRMSDKDMQILEKTSKKLGISMSDVVRDGINQQHNMAKGR